MKEKTKETISLAAAAIIVTIAMITAVCAIGALAEETLTEAWVLCQPDSYINIRARANSRSEKAGYLLSGDRIWIDGKTADGFAHCDRMTNEAGEGWVYAGYIVFEEPKEINRRCRIQANGRVAARRTIDGERRTWLINGSEITVYQTAGEWAVTDEGFIKTEYIDLEGIR